MSSRSSWRTAAWASPTSPEPLYATSSSGPRIDELDLTGIDAQRVRFEDCRVGTLRLHGGSLSDVDLRGLEMRTVSGVGSLAGATVSSGQISELAPLLAQHLGLRVTDQDHAQNATTRSRRA